ncbi:MAG: glycosyltransferase family 4 protein [Flavobacteriales bacterium]|nr:glycosyltransferase family 4 protein [Flavobacteriales bacterium]
MKKVLIITYYWPPMGGGGVQRWLKMSKYFREFGWEPIIFTTENGEASVVDESIVSEIPEKTQTLRVPIWEPFDLYKKLLGKKKDEKIAPGMGQETSSNSILHKLSIWVRGNFFIPDARMFWIKPSVAFLDEYLKKNTIDAIVSTGPPHTTHLIALRITKKIKIPWIADFRDPWTNIDFYHKLMLTSFADKKHKRLELEVLRNATKVVTVTWSWAKDFEKIVNRKIDVITNGFDPNDFTESEVQLDEKFSITHAGSLNEDRNPKFLWQVLHELTQELENFSQDLEIKLIGQIDVSVQQDVKQCNLERNLTRFAHLPHGKVISHLISSQILLLPLNDVPNINGVVPGKLFEYIGAKRPILCIGKSTGDASKIIQETNSGIVVDFKDKTLLKRAITSYYLEYKNKNLRISSEGFEKYSRKVLAKQYANALTEITTQQQ